MTTLNARAGQAWAAVADEPTDTQAGFDHQRAAFEEGWETGHKTAAKEIAEAIADALESYPGGEQIRTSLAALLARQIGGLS